MMAVYEKEPWSVCPRSTNLSGATNYNRTNVYSFYNKMEIVNDSDNLEQQNIINIEKIALFRTPTARKQGVAYKLELLLLSKKKAFITSVFWKIVLENTISPVFKMDFTWTE